MEITVKLHGVLCRDRFKTSQLEVPDGCSVDEVVERLQLPLSLLDIALVNGVHTNRAHVLRKGDVLSLLPLLEGG